MPLVDVPITIIQVNHNATKTLSTNSPHSCNNDNPLRYTGIARTTDVVSSIHGPRGVQVFVDQELHQSGIRKETLCALSSEILKANMWRMWLF